MFGRTRKDVETRAGGERFQSFFEFSQTFKSASITALYTDTLAP